MQQLIERLYVDAATLFDCKPQTFSWTGEKWRWCKDAGADLRALLDNLTKPTHRHKKRGSEYVLIGYGKMQAEDWVTDHGRDGSRLVDMLEVAIYRAVEDGSLWVRPKPEFEDGRFEDLRPMT